MHVDVSFLLFSREESGLRVDVLQVYVPSLVSEISRF